MLKLGGALAKLLALLGCLCVISTSAKTAAASETIHISEVDAGQGLSAIEVSTPWGDYVAIDQGGGTYWVGTYAEYERARVIGIERDSRYRPSTVNDSGATITFVGEDTLHAQMGDVKVDGITPSIDFASDSGSPNDKWVDVTWSQSGRAACYFYAPSTKHTYFPSQIDTSQPPFLNESFVLPQALLTKPVLLVFVRRGGAPAVLRIRSIAKLDYAISNALAVELQGYRIKLSARQVKHLAYLKALDPSLPTLPPAAPQPTSTPTLMQLDTVVHTFQEGSYPWTCIDLNAHTDVVVKRGDQFKLNTQPRPDDTQYGITIRPSIYESANSNKSCLVDVKALNEMAGITHNAATGNSIRDQVPSVAIPVAALGDQGIVGTWQGTAHDAAGLVGKFTLTFTLDASGVGAQWSADYGGLGHGGGPIANYQRINPRTITFEIPSRVAGCVKAFTASLDQSGVRMLGTYVATPANCVPAEGQFSVSKLTQP